MMVSRRGPVPHPNAMRNNAPNLGRQELSGRPGEGRPLPEYLRVQTPAAARFWQVWAQSPQTEAWLETDWLELETVTALVDAMHTGGDMRLAAEIRQRVGRWGATVEDRARLRMTFDRKEPQEGSGGGSERLSDDAMDEALERLLSRS